MTVTFSCTVASLIVTSTCVFWPTETSTFPRVAVAKPGIVTVIEYLPGATLRNRKTPLASTLAVRGAAGPVRVAVPPGIGAPVRR